MRKSSVLFVAKTVLNWFAVHLKIKFNIKAILFYLGDYDDILQKAMYFIGVVP